MERGNRGTGEQGNRGARKYVDVCSISPSQTTILLREQEAGSSKQWIVSELKENV